MSRAYIPENQVVRELWYFMALHTAMILNQVMGHLSLKPTTPFDLVQNAKTDSKTWFELFSIGYFNHHIEKSKSELNYKQKPWTELQWLEMTSKIPFLNNPITTSYYFPPAFYLDESRLLITNFPYFLQFDGGPTCCLI